MYNTHAPAIANSARQSAEGFTRAATFVLLSIRQPIWAVPSQMDEVDAQTAEAPSLFGRKRDGYSYITAQAHRLLPSILDCGQDTARAIAALIKVPSLGIPKAAFLAQMMGFDVGCLDSRNVARLGVRSIHGYRIDDVGPNTVAMRIDRYVSEFGGRARELWNDWCEDAAQAYPAQFPGGAEAVSELHLCACVSDFVPF